MECIWKKTQRCVHKTMMPLKIQAVYIIDRSINVTINLNIIRFNHQHCHVCYCLQLLCGEILTVLYCQMSIWTDYRDNGHQWIYALIFYLKCELDLEFRGINVSRWASSHVHMYSVTQLYCSSTFTFGVMCDTKFGQQKFFIDRHKQIYVPHSPCYGG